MIRRRLFATAVKVSLLTCLAISGLWVYVEFTGDHSLSYGTSPRWMVGFNSNWGSIWFKSDVEVTKQQIAGAVKQFAAETEWPTRDFNFELVQTVRHNSEDSGFQYEILDYRAEAIPVGGSSGIPWTSHSLGQRRSIILSLWWPLIASLLLPWLAVLRLARGRMVATGSRCRTCGCDLAGVPGYICPECRAARIERILFNLAFVLSVLLCISAMVFLPFWVTILAASQFAFIWPRPRDTGGSRRCLECSYSLTGNTSGVCPECGTPVPKKAEAAA